jgi:hypothetical protein
MRADRGHTSTGSVVIAQRSHGSWVEAVRGQQDGVSVTSSHPAAVALCPKCKSWKESIGGQSQFQDFRIYTYRDLIGTGDWKQEGLEKEEIRTRGTPSSFADFFIDNLSLLLQSK